MRRWTRPPCRRSSSASDLADIVLAGRRRGRTTPPAAIYDDFVGQIDGVVGADASPRSAHAGPARRSSCRPRGSRHAGDLVVDVGGPPEAIVPSLRAVVAALDRSLPLYLAAPPCRSRRRVRWRRTGLRPACWRRSRRRRWRSPRSAMFGVFSADVAVPAKEIGIRLALGARAHRSWGGCSASALRRAAAGIAAGVLMALVAHARDAGAAVRRAASDPASFVLVGGRGAGGLARRDAGAGLRAIRRAPLSVLREC